MPFRLRSNILLFLSILLLFLLVLVPLIKPGTLVTDDGNWMIIRLSAFYQSLREGQFPVRLLGRLNYSYGYPVANFLYPGYLYIGSLIKFLGVPFSGVTEIITVVFLALGMAGVYGWLRSFFAVMPSLLGVASYILNPYLLYDVYKRGSIGEVVAIGTGAVCLYACEREKKAVFSVAIALLTISHNTVALFFGAFLFFYALVRRRFAMLAPMFLGIGIASFFWMPALLEKRFVLFDTVAISIPSHYFASGADLVLQSMPYLVLGVVGYLVAPEKFRGLRSIFMVFLVMSFILATGASAAVWNIDALAKVVQFPFRILLFTCFLGPWLLAYSLSGAKSVRRPLLGLVGVLVLLIFSLPYQSAKSIRYEEGYFTTNEATTTVADEFMPAWIKKYPNIRPAGKLEVHKGNAAIRPNRVLLEKVDATIDAKEPSVIQVNALYYPGWGALLNESPVPISYDNDYGIMRIDVPPGTHRLYMAFRETTSRFVADVISLVCIAVWLIVFVIVPLTGPAVKRTYGKKK